jgi:hypothetical protein
LGFPKCPLSWALVHVVSDKSEILTKQQQNLVYYCSKGDKELKGRWVGFFVDNVNIAHVHLANQEFLSKWLHPLNLINLIKFIVKG